MLERSKKFFKLLCVRGLDNFLKLFLNIPRIIIIILNLKKKFIL